MILPFNEMPLGSRIWIYQSDKKILDQDLIKIKTKLTEFLKNWTAHGDDLKSSFEIRYDRFIIIALNEKSAKASGCSIDACVHFIQQIENDYNISLLDKMNVTFKMGEHVTFKTLLEFKKLAKEKAVSANTVVFNNLVNTVGEWQDFWEVPASESWHNRFF
jgi:hypothetical protein